jgi:hypothetical protein
MTPIKSVTVLRVGHLRLRDVGELTGNVIRELRHQPRLIDLPDALAQAVELVAREAPVGVDGLDHPARAIELETIGPLERIRDEVLMSRRKYLIRLQNRETNL